MKRRPVPNEQERDGVGRDGRDEGEQGPRADLGCEPIPKRGEDTGRDQDRDHQRADREPEMLHGSPAGWFYRGAVIEGRRFSAFIISSSIRRISGLFPPFLLTCEYRGA